MPLQDSLSSAERDAKRKALLIRAWDEFAEGGVVVRTQCHRCMKLETAKAIFNAPAGGEA